MLLSLIAGCSATGNPSAVDTDQDGLTDEIEEWLGADPTNLDTDLDGVDDGAEIDAGSSPLATDSDNDGIPDGADSLLGPPSRVTGAVSSGNDLEPNGAFAQAVLHPSAGASRLRLLGRVDFRGDVDVYNLGSVRAGDQIIIDFDPLDGIFQPMIGLFDEEELLIDRAEDRRETGGVRFDGLLTRTMRHATDACFVGIANRTDEPSTGEYQFDIRIIRDGSIRLPAAQIVFLDFDGGVLENPLLGVSTISPFSGAAIGATYAGDDDAIKRSIVSTFVENYERHAVDVYSSDDVEVPPADQYTTIFFGSFNASVFGVSKSVDPYNIDKCDDGIIFTESFASGAFGYSPPPESLGVAIGNVAAHEVGHLLGLNHVIDPTAIMDATSPAIFLLEDQTFMTAPLDERVFPIGEQDDVLLLNEIVGAR